MAVTFRHGWNRTPAERPRPRFDAALRASYVPPPSADFHSRVGAVGMHLNDQWGDCVSPDTLVLTADLRWQPAGELELGDALLSFEEYPPQGSHGGRSFSVCEVEKNDVVRRPCYELRFDDGTTVTCSSGHRWLVKSQVQKRLGTQQWVRTEDLRCDEVNSHQVYKPLDVWQEDSSWDAGYAAAGFDGEGCVSRSYRNSYRVSFAQTDNSMLEQMRATLKALGFEFSEKINSRHRLLRQDGTPRKSLHSLEIGRKRDMLRFLGTVRPRRLMDRFYAEGGARGRLGGEAVRLISKTYVGEQDVVMLDTSSRTYFANGLASHNCTCACDANIVQGITCYGQGSEVVVPDSVVLQAYEQSGFNPNAGPPGSNPTDQGWMVSDALALLKNSGMSGHRIAGYGQLASVKDHTAVMTCAAEFGYLSIGINLPQSAMDAVNAGRLVWDVEGDGTIIGGHCTCVCGYTATGPVVWTWGLLVQVTWSFWDTYVEEAWPVVSQDWVSAASGKDPEGVDLVTLGAEFAAVTGQNPFPAPAPAPSPAPPPPAPAPPVPPVPSPGCSPFSRTLSTLQKWRYYSD